MLKGKYTFACLLALTTAALFIFWIYYVGPEVIALLLTLFSLIIVAVDFLHFDSRAKSFADRMIIMAVKIGHLFSRIWSGVEKAEKLAVMLGWWIPRKYRGAIIGDIIEDCHEMREMHCGEWRILIQVLWQWAIAVLTLVPAAFFGGIWRIFSPPK